MCYSIPTRRQPIPRQTVSIYFTLDVSKVRQKVGHGTDSHAVTHPLPCLEHADSSLVCVRNDAVGSFARSLSIPSELDGEHHLAQGETLPRDRLLIVGKNASSFLCLSPSLLPFLSKINKHQGKRNKIECNHDEGINELIDIFIGNVHIVCVRACSSVSVPKQTVSLVSEEKRNDNN